MRGDVTCKWLWVGFCVETCGEQSCVRACAFTVQLVHVRGACTVRQRAVQAPPPPHPHQPQPIFCGTPLASYTTSQDRLCNTGTGIRPSVAMPAPVKPTKPGKPQSVASFFRNHFPGSTVSCTLTPPQCNRSCLPLCWMTPHVPIPTTMSLQATASAPFPMEKRNILAGKL